MSPLHSCGLVAKDRYILSILCENSITARGQEANISAAKRMEGRCGKSLHFPSSCTAQGCVEWQDALKV